MFSLQEPPLFTRLKQARRILVAGAGGGFDVFAGLPIAVELWEAGKRVHLANLSFSRLHGLDLEVWVDQDVAAIGPETESRDSYFPERSLARWLEAHDLPSTVYAFPRVGVAPLRAAYRVLVERLDIDAIVLVDGGTDILMRGDEAGLGTPEEDMASLAAVHGLDVGEKVVVCLGFGVDAYHGVNHVQVLENLAALDRDGAYLGAFSIPRASRASELYLDAVAYAHADTPDHPSIVNGSIAAALDGQFGDAHFTTRTSGSELFINPLMAVYFAVDMDALARRSLYLSRLEGTILMRQISSIIESFRAEATPRPPRAFPH
ncbi:hypothetical protein Aph01nite_06250 [Acrocarpospora phusangensis]|uniref:DUF1152 domain-containing protein n=1 Tax=Acrocarpospora phusangensis TaxID=1070424 RepID=A0A919Q8T9_9ACTN|nr:DUF1152 domain-containing protein [Acrocarpospora phusangensis]GIH22315.1 hypothetical protein Aph01nite_06250 [Acrocarpospora phusangensis]